MRRFLVSLIGILFLLFPSISISAPTSRDSFEWDGTTITKFIGKETDVVIPGGTTEIGDEAFYNCSFLKSVTIPEGVTWIGYDVFFNCRSLTSIVIPESVEFIGAVRN